MPRSRQIEHTHQFFEQAARGWNGRYDANPAVNARKEQFLNALNARIPRTFWTSDADRAPLPDISAKQAIA